MSHLCRLSLPTVTKPLLGSIGRRTVSFDNANQHHNHHHRTLGQEPRFNPLGIEMLPDKLHRQVFGIDQGTDCDIRTSDSQHKRIIKDNLQKCIQHLRRHDLLPKQLSEIDTIYEYHKNLSVKPKQEESDAVTCDIPKLEGANIDQHFRNLGYKYSLEYKHLATSLIHKGRSILDKRPEYWSQRAGWTRYEPSGNGFIIQQVDHPLEQSLIFDVETCMSDDLKHAPTLAVALSEKAWYSWTSPRLIEDQKTHQQITTQDLIPFESSLDDAKLIIGHNVSFDRSFLADQYDLMESRTKFLDTLSLHVCVCGLTGLQRAAKVAHKRKMKDDEAIEREDVETNPWIEKSSLNNLADVYEFHCGNKISKDDREIFVTGSMEDVRDNFQSLMTYCATDVRATFEVFEKLFSKFSERFPHPITLAGMLEMSTMYLPVNADHWQQYVERSQSTYDEFEQRLSSSLQELANEACSMRKEDYSRNVWLWDLDWSTQSYKPNKSKLVAWRKQENLEQESIDVQVQKIYDTKFFMRRINPFMPGFPKWYRELCCPPNKAQQLLKEKDWQPGPCLISTQMRITPKLMKLTWCGYPLHHHPRYGWGYLVPNGDPLAEIIQLPEDHPYAKFPVKEFLNMCKDLPNSLILVDDPSDELSLLQEDEVRRKIEELRENTQLSTPNLIKLLKKLSKKKKVAPKYKSEYCEDVEIPGAHFIRLPHKNGPNFNVGNPLGRDFVSKMEDGTLSSFDNDLASLLLRHSSSASYWKNNQKRIKSQMVVAQSENNSDYSHAAILPRVIVAGTVTRRAVEPTWLTASNQDTTRIGSELKAMIQAPPGYCYVGADVDSQELWIASLMGDSYSYQIHGGTGLSYMTLRGSKSDKTDMHSKTASLVGITRDDAKVLNYARIYGAGQKFIERFLMNSSQHMNEQQAKEKAKTIFKETKGVRKYVKDARKESQFYWVGGTESDTFNKLEEIASSSQPRTPVLDCQISEALEPSQDQAQDFVTSRVNWVVQSSAVDFLHLILVNMKWLFERLDIKGRFSISIHDEVRYLVREEDRYKAAFALHVSNLLVRAYFAHRLNMRDLPISVAFFSSVDIDKCLRKEVNMECRSPSNPQGLSLTYNIPHGESLDVDQTLKKLRETMGQTR